MKNIKILCEVEVEEVENVSEALSEISQMMTDYYKHYPNSKIIKLKGKRLER